MSITIDPETGKVLVSNGVSKKKADALYQPINTLNEDASAPTGQANGYTAVVNDILYYFTGGNRYKLTATLDNPVAVPIETGNPIGLLLSLTYTI